MGTTAYLKAIMEVYGKTITGLGPQAWSILIMVSYTLCFGCGKETSQGDVSFTRPNLKFDREIQKQFILWGFVLISTCL